MIAMPNADSHNERVLQEDNTDLAYEFVSTAYSNCKIPESTTDSFPDALQARKFPGYTAESAQRRRTAQPPPRPLTPLPKCTQTSTRRGFTKSPRAASASSPPVHANPLTNCAWFQSHWCVFVLRRSPPGQRDFGERGEAPVRPPRLKP